MRSAEVAVGVHVICLRPMWSLVNVPKKYEPMDDCSDSNIDDAENTECGDPETWISVSQA